MRSKTQRIMPPAWALTASVVLLSGCSSSTYSPSGSEAPSSTQIEASTNNVRNQSSARTVYVGNISESQSYVTVFSGNASQVVRTIPSINVIIGMAVDSSGYLFVSTDSGTRNQALQIYGDRGAKLLQTLRQTKPFYGPTLDRDGNLFVWCQLYEVCEYAAGGAEVVQQKVIWRLRLQKYRLSGEIAVDPSGDVAIGGRYEVLVFQPGTSKPYWKITSSPSQSAIAFDRNGNLFVATLSPSQGSATISVYLPRKRSPSQQINVPNSSEVLKLSFDASSNLYALSPTCDNCSPEVTIFAPNASKPALTITDGLQSLLGGLTMAVNSSGAVYIAGLSTGIGSGSLIVYPPGKAKPLRAVSKGAENPRFLEVTP